MLAVVLASVAVQIVLARYAVGGRFAFDFVLVGVVFAALASGAVGGMLAGTIGGLLQDLFCRRYRRRQRPGSRRSWAVSPGCWGRGSWWRSRTRGP